ncbi:PAS domain-containing protein [Rhizobium sp. BK275]|uniref:PAS domain-containing protein n=1 Tax=Rhizobium sp. BK275 TaxID=2587077 RepID=UPI00161806F4|nr:PAS domain-containing protein [Rhizobium sp. BK275]MBB3390256.1 PAS domain-containing protein [Rhizobium sp. BK275]
MTAIVDFECLTDKDEFPICETGFFIWDIVTNLLYGDGAVAEMFGLDPSDAASGLPLEAYISRIHPEDQPAAARIIHDTILTQEPEHQSYRTRCANGAFHQVMAFGRCFRDKNGIPSLYGGIVLPLPEEAPVATPLLDHCLAAYDIALREGNVAVADHILEALMDLDWKNTGCNRPN